MYAGVVDPFIVFATNGQTMAQDVVGAPGSGWSVQSALSVVSEEANSWFLADRLQLAP